ncbi:hypothetical protein PHISCL_08183 [Aspergillus sclerotialis]|uniref:Ubiquitin-like modifier-activating enzyme ATG7 n=1 Tax=Aspergillus sclerotialis TaxID=2070753 RepID=A0A3A2Z8P7_9EURO|nr:hypothetical protein PHISCL_08183 [Aspergillus sclerotialis]
MQYTPFASAVELPFYTALASRKINHDKLDDSPHHILGLYEIRPTDPPNVSCRVQVHGNALTNDKAPTGYYRAEGTIRNVNTIEEYRSIDKAKLLEQAGKTIWDAISDGSIYSCPSRLASFIVLSFADLKKFRFHCWFAFPALHSAPSWTPQDPDKQGTPSFNQHDDHNTSGGRNLSDIENSTLVDAVQAWNQTIDEHQRGFFLARKFRGGQHGAGTVQAANRMSSHASSETVPSVEPGFSWEIARLSAYEDGFFDGVPFADCYVCFADPSNYDHAPGWILRNLLVLVKRRWRLDTIQILRYRGVQSKHGHGRSKMITLASKPQVFTAPRDEHEPVPKVTGWERNPAGKLAGRVVNLTEYLDPKRYSHL